MAKVPNAVEILPKI